MKLNKLILLLLLVLMLVGCGKRNTQSSKIDDFIDDLNERDYDSAYNMVHESQRAAIKEKKFLETLMTRLNNIEHHAITEEDDRHYVISFEGKVADETITIAFDDNMTFKIMNINNSIEVYDETIKIDNKLDEHIDNLINHTFDHKLGELLRDGNQELLESNVRQILEYTGYNSLYDLSPSVEKDDISASVTFTHEDISFFIELVQDPVLSKWTLDFRSLDSLLNILSMSEVIPEPELYLEEDTYTIKSEILMESSQSYNDSIVVATNFNELLLNEDYKEAYGHLNDHWIRNLSLEEFMRYITLNMKRTDVTHVDSLEGYGTTFNPLKETDVFLNTFMRIDNATGMRSEYHVEILNEVLETNELPKIQNIYFQKFINDNIIFDEMSLENMDYVEAFLSTFKMSDPENLRKYGYDSLTEIEFEELILLQQKLVGSFKVSTMKLGTYKTRSKDYWISEYVCSNQAGNFRLILTQNKIGEVIHFCVVNL